MRRMLFLLVPLLIMARPRPIVTAPGTTQQLPDTPPPGVDPADFHPMPDDPSMPIDEELPMPTELPEMPIVAGGPDTPPPGVSQGEFDRTRRNSEGFGPGPGSIISFGLLRAVRAFEAARGQVGYGEVPIDAAIEGGAPPPTGDGPEAA